MNAQELKLLLTDEQIVRVVNTLGSDMVDKNNKEVIFNTIACHGGKAHSHKLYYYPTSKMFHCYSECGQVGSILDLVMLNKGYTLPEAITYVCNLLSISMLKQGFTPDISGADIISDWSFINSYRRKKAQKPNLKSVFYDERILNIFQDIYTSEWMDDGITAEVMKAFEIKYCTLKQSIIIPHRDINGGLIGVRQRNLLEDSIDNFGKYCPFYIHGITYKHPLGEHLYGLHKNIECIKRVKKVMLLESEKGVLQAASLFNVDSNFTLALCGNHITNHQKDILISLGVEEAIIAVDKQWQDINSEEYNLWLAHVRDKLIQPLSPYMKVYVIWDTEGLLKYKQSPTDAKRETLLKLMQQKIYVGT